MRILVYLAALAIFLFIVNLGAQWLGDDELEAPAPVVAEAPGMATMAPAQGQQNNGAVIAPATAPPPAASIEAAVDEPLSDVVPAIDTAVLPDTATAKAATATPIGRQGPATESTASVAATNIVPDAATADPLTELAELEEPAPNLPTTVEPPAELPQAPIPEAAPSSAIERFASNAQTVAEDAVDSVSSTLKTVSAAMTGDNGDGLNEPLVPDSIAALMRRHEGRELLVLFWHPQDQTVTESFEWLGRMQTRYGNQGITTVAVNLASELGNSGERTVAHGSNIEQRSDPERILARAFWVQQVPSIYLLGADGMLLRRIEGFDQAQIGSYEDSVRQAARR